MKKGIMLLVMLISFASCGKSLVDKSLSNRYYKTSTGKIAFSQGDKFLWIELTELKNVDKKTFTVLGAYYAKDKNNIYFGSEIINNADVESFILLEKNGFISKDKNNVFYERTPIKGVSPLGIEILAIERSNSNIYLRNNDGIYWFRGNDINTLAKLAVEDKKKFMVINSDRELSREGKKIFYQGTTLPVKYEENFKDIHSSMGTAFLNGNSLYVISWKDSLGSIADKVRINTVPLNTVYGISYLQEYKGIGNMEEAHPWVVLNGKILGIYAEELNSVNFIAEINGKYKIQGKYAFAGDKVYTFEKIKIDDENRSVYLNKKVRTEIITIENKSKDFQVLEIKWNDNGIPDTRYAKNEKNVYFLGEILEGADPKTVEAAPLHGYDKVNKRYYRYDVKDKNSYYKNGKLIDSKDAEKK